MGASRSLPPEGQAEALRQGKGTGTVSTAYLLPQQVDVQRYLAETTLRAVQVLRLTVVKIIRDQPSTRPDHLVRPHLPGKPGSDTHHSRRD